MPEIEGDETAVEGLIPPSHRKPETEFSLGLRTKKLRTDKGIKVRDLCAATGLAQSTISKIENGLMSPTFDVIQKLAAGLGVDIAQLFADAPSRTTPGMRAVTRKGQGRRHDAGVYAHEVLCPEIEGKRMHAFITTIRARSLRDFKSLVRQNGQEFFHVLEGKVRVFTDIYEPLDLNGGDSMYFDTSMGHATVSVGEKDAQVLWVYCA